MKGIKMSNTPEWVDPDAPDPEPEPVRVTEREVLIETVRACNETLASSINVVRNALLRLDEIGAPVTRSRSRANKLDEARTDWWAHFEYDVIKGNTRGTKDQQMRAERHDLS
jgi:hypothetical protein